MSETRAYEFKKEFEERSGDKIKCMLMARAYGSPDAVSSAGLEIMPGRKELWGILIFGEKCLHFFVHPSENTMSLLFRTAARADPPKEQWAKFPAASIRNINIPVKNKGFLSRFFPSLSVVELSFVPEGRNNPLSLYFESISPVKDPGIYEAAKALVLDSGNPPEETQPLDSRENS